MSPDAGKTKSKSWLTSFKYWLKAHLAKIGILIDNWAHSDLGEVKILD